MNREKQLRLSLFSVPDLSIGRAPLTPQNSQSDPRRLQYLEGMVAYLNGLFESLRRDSSQSEALSRLEELLVQVPYSDLAKVDRGGNPVVTEIPSARDRIVFNHDRLRINFLDGLHRRPESAGIPAGRHSPTVSHIMSKLSGGISEKALSRILVECDVNLSSVIGSVRDLELIEEVDPSEPIVPQSLLEGKKDRLTWLGHACILFQTSRSSICVDPLLRPHIKWTDNERASLFSDSFGERFFFEPYGPQLTQLSPAQLPPLDAVFVTHQDVDHCNLGVLMMLPEEVPIVVPECHPAHPWEVDLSTLVRNVLGRRRRVIRLKHGETITIGDIRATAFPFSSEMPSSLKTLWNCYLFETDRAAVACTADSAITDETIDFLVQRLRGKRKVSVLCARLVHSGETSPGFREGDNLFNFTRLWAWYVPIWDLFQPVEVSGISADRLGKLSERTNLRFYLPYAMGTAPWYRIADVKDPLHIPMANLSAGEVDALVGALKAISGGPTLFPGKFAQPCCLAE
jgi:L-ascorbate metabolism protein UlaG (beta-lactamase superfamily)